MIIIWKDKLLWKIIIERCRVSVDIRTCTDNYLLKIITWKVASFCKIAT